jgi:hypothetical protein
MHERAHFRFRRDFTYQVPAYSEPPYAASGYFNVVSPGLCLSPYDFGGRRPIHKIPIKLPKIFLNFIVAILTPHRDSELTHHRISKTIVGHTLLILRRSLRRIQQSELQRR